MGVGEGLISLQPHQKRMMDLEMGPVVRHGTLVLHFHIENTTEKNDLGELSLCGDARSSEKPRTNEGN